MKKGLFLLLFIFPILLLAQQKPVSERVKSLEEYPADFISTNLFSLKTKDMPLVYSTVSDDITRLDINNEVLEWINRETPQFIKLQIPYQNTQIEVKLYQQQILSEDFYAKDHKGNLIDYRPGVYYRGIVSGDYSSIAALSFFENNVMGVVSTLEKGNIVIGKTKNSKEYISYSDRNLKIENTFKCGVEELDTPFEEVEEPATQTNSDTAFSNCVGLYYEITNEMFIQNNSDEFQTLNWLTGVQNNISVLYDNEGISLVIESLKLWTEPDPYGGDYEDYLYDFVYYNPQFDGDLGHLISYPTTTSVAFLDSLCSYYNYAYSGVDTYYEEVPLYSWTILAMAHEMGHSLGSPHTHSCSWNGNNTAIDGCASYYDPAYGEGCNGPLPWDTGGTVMSYCHLVSGLGINLALGFGDQPGSLIKNNVDNKYCLSTECVSYNGFEFQVITKVNTVNAGTVQGGGVYLLDETATVIAEANPGFYFINWTENGNEISSDFEYQFTVSNGRMLTANFKSFSLVSECAVEYLPGANYPENQAVISGESSFASDFKVESGDVFRPYILNIPVQGMVDYFELTFYKDSEMAPGEILRSPIKIESFTMNLIQAGIYNYQMDLSAYNLSFGGGENGELYWLAVRTQDSGFGSNKWIFANSIHNETNMKVQVDENAEWQDISADYDGAFTFDGICGDGEEGIHFVGVYANPSFAGTVAGGGFYTEGEQINVSAEAAGNYKFIKWTENEELISEQNSFSFQLTSYRNLVAHFEEILSVDKNSETQISIYPNPFSEKININASGILLNKIEIFDLRGRAIDVFEPDSETFQISAEAFSTGQYILRITTENRVEVFHVVKK